MVTLPILLSNASVSREACSVFGDGQRANEGETSTGEQGKKFQCSLSLSLSLSGVSAKKEKVGGRDNRTEGNEKLTSTLLAPHASFFTHAYIRTPNSPFGRSLCLACLDTSTLLFSNRPSMYACDRVSDRSLSSTTKPEEQTFSLTTRTPPGLRAAWALLRKETASSGMGTSLGEVVLAR